MGTVCIAVAEITIGLDSSFGVVDLDSLNKVISLRRISCSKFILFVKNSRVICQATKIHCVCHWQVLIFITCSWSSVHLTRMMVSFLCNLGAHLGFSYHKNMG